MDLIIIMTRFGPLQIPVIRSVARPRAANTGSRHMHGGQNLRAANMLRPHTAVAEDAAQQLPLGEDQEDYITPQETTNTNETNHPHRPRPRVAGPEDRLGET